MFSDPRDLRAAMFGATDPEHHDELTAVIARVTGHTEVTTAQGLAARTAWLCSLVEGEMLGAQVAGADWLREPLELLRRDCLAAFEVATAARLWCEAQLN